MAKTDRIMRLTFIQTELHWENRDKNLRMFDQLVGSVKNSDLVILPEMFTTGFTMNAKVFAEDMSGTTVSWMVSTAKKKKMALCGSVIIKDKRKYFNRFIWVSPNGEIFCYDKRHLFRMAGEHEYYSPGKEKIMIHYKGWNILPMVCYDLRFPVWSRNIDGENDLMIYVANWPEARKEPWKKLLMARAIENQCYVAGINRIGKDGKGIPYSGDSIVVDFKGDVISKTKAKTKSVETVELSLKNLNEFRTKFPAYMDADEFEIF